MADILIRMEMPRDCSRCSIKVDPDTRQCCVDKHLFEETLSVLISRRDKDCPLVELPPHGALIDRDRLMEDGWVLHKEVIRMGGYAIYEQPLNYPDIPVIVPADKEET